MNKLTMVWHRSRAPKIEINNGLFGCEEEPSVHKIEQTETWTVERPIGRTKNGENVYSTVELHRGEKSEGERVNAKIRWQSAGQLAVYWSAARAFRICCALKTQCDVCQIWR
jgi:hypothetical protein